MKNLLSLVLVLIAFTTTSMAQNITGVWKTIDDETGKEKSYITISEENGVYKGVVSKILNEDRQDAKCDKCKGAQKNQPILGLQIISGLEKTGEGKFSNGKIMDPQKGKTYDLVIIPNGSNELTIKGGYKVLGKMVGRTQQWYRINE